MALYAFVLVCVALGSAGAWLVLAVALVRGRRRRESLAALARLDELQKASVPPAPASSAAADAPVSVASSADFPSFLM